MSNMKPVRGPPHGKDAKRKKPDAKGFDSPTKKAKSFTAPPDAAGTKPSAKDRKQLAQQKKVKVRRNYATIHDSVVLWEKLRQKTTSREEKAKLARTIIRKVDGKVAELANHHSASRVIQFAMRDAAAPDKKALTAEVRAHVVELSKSKYGHHLVQKLIALASKDEVPGLAKLFRGHVAELLRHPHGADVMVDLYDVCPASLRSSLCAELYGREFSLFEDGGGGARLADVLAGAEPARRRGVLASLSRGLAPVLEKALLHPPMVHRLLREMLEVAPGLTVQDTVDTLAATGGAMLKMVHTHDGAAAACMALAYGSARDRKRLVRGMKGYVREMAENEWGHAVVCTALSVVDDTALLAKVIGSELKAHMATSVAHQHARRPLLHLLAPSSTRHLPTATREMMHPPQRTVRGGRANGGGGGGGGGADSDEEPDAGEAATGQPPPSASSAAAPEAERVLGESKKDADTRRREVLAAGGAAGSLGAALVAAVVSRPEGLLCDRWGADVAVEVASGGEGGVLWEAHEGQLRELHAAIAAAAAVEAPSEGGAAEPSGSRAEAEGGDGEAHGAPAPAGPLLTDFFASRALRRLLLAGGGGGRGETDAAAARAFAAALWSEALSGRCQRWVGTHGEKVLAALLQCGEPAVVAGARAELSALVSEPLDAWVQRYLGPQQAGQQHQQQRQRPSQLQPHAQASIAGQPCGAAGAPAPLQVRKKRDKRAAQGATPAAVQEKKPRG